MKWVLRICGALLALCLYVSISEKKPITDSQVNWLMGTIFVMFSFASLLSHLGDIAESLRKLADRDEE